jgi:hypothetical protein
MEKIAMGFRRMRIFVLVVIRKICVGKMEKLTLGWREF